MDARDNVKPFGRGQVPGPLLDTKLLPAPRLPFQVSHVGEDPFHATGSRDGSGARLRDELLRQIPELRSKYESYAAFGASRMEDIFSASELSQANVLEAYVFASSLAVNNGDGTFALQALPIEVQFAPIYAVLAEDFDGDGHTDLLAAGNFHGVPPVRGRYDASYGMLLRGNGEGRFESVDMEASNLVIEGQVRDMRMLRRADGDRLIIVARNNDRLQILLHKP